MDALSDMLSVIRLKGGVFLRAHFTAPWCVISRVYENDLGPYLDGAEHIMLYHYVVEGRLVARVGNDRPLEIEAGQVVLLPHNHMHLLGSDVQLPPVPSRDIVHYDPNAELFTITHGGGGQSTRVVCGFLGCERVDGNPLLQSLPALIRFDTREAASEQWIRSSFEFAASALQTKKSSDSAILARLSELLFMEAVRHYVEELPDDQNGWLGGLKDPVVARTLALIHARVKDPWTVDDLGREVGLSRSALADRFVRTIGEPPMRYLTRWRIQLAAHRLRDRNEPIARIAEEVGYDAEAAFGRAFKRVMGQSPAAWRNRRG